MLLLTAMREIVTAASDRKERVTAASDSQEKKSY